MKIWGSIRGNDWSPGWLLKDLGDFRRYNGSNCSATNEFHINLTKSNNNSKQQVTTI